MGNHTFQAGVGRVSITPPLTAPHAGWGAQTHILPDGVESDLAVTALVVDDGRERAAYVELDLVIISREESNAIRSAVGHVLGIPPSAVRACVTHNHAGPPPSSWDWVAEGRDALRRYYEQLPDLAASAARLAVRDLRAARIAVGSGESNVAVNRRETAPDGRPVTGVNPGGVIDPQVFVVRIDDLEQRPLAVIVGYTMHPTTLGPSNRLISSDWPGHLKRTVETITGATCLFAQGATGNVGPGPVGYTDDVRVVRRLGARVGCEAARVFLDLDLPPVTYRHERTWESGAPLGKWIAEPVAETAPLVRTAARQIDLPLVPQPSMAEADVEVAAAERRLNELRESGAPAAEVEAATFVTKRANMTRTRAQIFGGRETFPVDLHLLQIGPALFAGVEGEPFCETAMVIKAASPVPATWFGGYTGGWLGYVPTAEEYPRRGYEVDTSPYQPTAAATLEAATIGALKDFAGTR